MSMTHQTVARCALRLAHIADVARARGGDVTDEEVRALAEEFGADAARIALQAQAWFLEEEAAALEAFYAVREAMGKAGGAA